MRRNYKFWFVSFIYFLFWTCSCSLSTKANKKNCDNFNNNVIMDSCENALNCIINRTFSKWNGFPSGCDVNSLYGNITINEDDFLVRYLGSDQIRVKMLMLNIEGYYRPSLCFDENSPVLFEAMHPLLNETAEEIIKSLGIPDAKLDWDFGTLHCQQSEYVYSGRGITLFLNIDQTKILHIALYNVVSLQTYVTSIRPELKKTSK